MNVDAEGRVWMREIRCCYTWRETCLLRKGMLYLCWCLCPCWSSCSWSCVQVEWVALERVVWTFWLIRPEVSSVKSWWCRACSVVAVDVVGETVVASVKRWNCVELLTWGWDDIPLTLLVFVASSRCDARCWSGCRCCWTLIAKSLFDEFSRCWCWLMFLIEGCERW